MGLMDFAKGVGEAVGNAAGNVGEAIGGDFVVDKIQDVPNVLRSADKALDTVAAGVSHLATNPTQIARGAGAAINFVQENPGKTWDTAFEVGRAVVKDQLDPVNLAITAGLVGATVLTGGAAAPALVGKLAMGARTAKAGFQAGRTASTTVRTLRAADKVLDATRAVDRATDAARTVDRVSDAARAVDKVADTGRALEKAGDVGRLDKFLGGNKTVNKITNPLENTIQSGRDKIATRILKTADGSEAGMARQITAAAVQGNTGAMPTRLAGQAENIASLNKTMWRGRQVGNKTIGYAQKAEGVEEAYDAASNPIGYATMKAGEHEGEARAFANKHADEIKDAAIKGADKRGVGQDTGYVDHGQTTENLYQQSEEVSQAAGSSGRGMHYWEGPRSQWAGGISSSYDWRKIDPLRPIRTGAAPGSRNQSVTESDEVEGLPDQVDRATKNTGDEKGRGGPRLRDRYMGQEQNDFGGKEQNDFGPEMSKGGAGPMVRTGEGSRSRHNVTNARTVKRPIGAIGTGSAKSSVIDADSSSPDDFKFDNSGQGYMDFANTMGTAAVGPQPNTSPMYRTGSRASSRRPAGMLGA